jgi:hypothetical protein
VITNANMYLVARVQLCCATRLSPYLYASAIIIGTSTFGYSTCSTLIFYLWSLILVHIRVVNPYLMKNNLNILNLGSCCLFAWTLLLPHWTQTLAASSVLLCLVRNSLLCSARVVLFCCSSLCYYIDLMWFLLLDISSCPMCYKWVGRPGYHYTAI